MKFTLAYVISNTQYRKRPKNNAQKTKFKRDDSVKNGLHLVQVILKLKISKKITQLLTPLFHRITPL